MFRRHFLFSYDYSIQSYSLIYTNRFDSSGMLTEHSQIEIETTQFLKETGLELSIDFVLRTKKIFGNKVRLSVTTLLLF